MAKLRSGEWYAGDDRNAYLHRTWMRRGAPPSAFSGPPQIAIANTASDLTPCNSHLNEVADAVKQGVYEAGAMELLRRTPAPTVTGAFASPKRGWERLYVDHVQQADTGGDLHFLVGASGPGVARESH
jgi:hypothetical protein